MRPCSDLPKTDDVSLKRDRQCVKAFTEKFSYEPLTILGKGSVGSVFGVYYRDNMDVQVAVKILPYGKTLKTLTNKELGIACELNSLSSVTPIFVTTLGYHVCSKIPQSWKDNLDYDEESEYVYVYMSRPQVGFADMGGYAYKVAGLDNRDYAISLLFILLHGLYVARKFLKFAHHDLHEGNFMFTPVDPAKMPNFELTVENVEHKVSFIRGWVPKVIDFGKSTTEKHPDTYAMNNAEDVAKIFRLFKQRRDLEKAVDLDELVKEQDPFEGLYNKQYRELLTSKFDNYKVIADFLLKDDLFQKVKTIERVVVKRQKRGGEEVKTFCEKQLEYLPF